MDLDQPVIAETDEVLQKVQQDDDEEWEYEYSTTETEVGSWSFCDRGGES